MANKRHTDYTVGWICALPVEMAAAIAMLDEEHPDLPTSPGDHNTYFHGRIGLHCIVIACLPLGIYGTASAASVAANMRSSYPLLQVGLMVGIAGGVPTAESDIRLGDVVVSKPTRDSGGVIQYDFGKTIAGGQFEHTGSLNKPPHAALTAMARLQAQQQLSQGHIPAILSQAAARYQGIDTDFVYPGQDQDQLFDSSYDHPNTEETCNSRDKARTVLRRPRASNSPRIHYGLIASGNQVMKHAATRDRLARKFGFLCFEMEAAGLVDHFPCVVVRGICDYADSHKNKQWQPYAAMTAAAYTKALLSIMPLTYDSRSARMVRWYGGDLRALPEPSFVATDRPDGECTHTGWQDLISTYSLQINS
ncbi:Pfs domain protein [Aspergillus unguis]